MKQFTIEVTVDRPGNGLDTIVSESGELTSANVKEVGERLQTVFDGFESEENEVKFAGTVTVTDEAGDVSSVVATNIKRGTIQAIIIAIQEINQTPPIIPNPGPQGEVM
jgi:hypothetical protein